MPTQAPNRIPRPATPFFGHETALARVAQWVATEPVISITGIGGAGKTRFAIALSDHLRASRTVDVAWVGLAELDDPAGIADAVATAVDTRPAGGESVIDALTRRFSRQPTVLVLDNCEHLLTACAELVGELTARCPNLAVITTSREILDVPGECVWRLDTLPLPECTNEAPPDIDAILATPGIALFVDRARRQRPEFRVDDSNVHTLTRLCRRLEGLPLALELAAAQLSFLSLDEIDSRMAEGLVSLRRHGKTGPQRHATMQASLAGSVDALAPDESRFFEALSVFRGSFSMDACHAMSTDFADATMERILTTLVDKSLVVAEMPGPQTRYRLLEPLRLYASQCIDGERAGYLSKRHAGYYTTLAATIARRLKGGDRPAALAELGMEYANIMAAWNQAVATKDPEAISTLASALFWYWNFANRFDEGRRLCEQAMSAGNGVFEDIPALQHATGALAWMQGDYGTARKHLEKAVALARAAGDDAKLGMALRERAGVYMTESKLAAALECIQAALAVLVTEDQAWDAALCLIIGGDALGVMGEADEAREMRQQARARFSELGDNWGEALAAFCLAFGNARAGNFDDALPDLHDALAMQKADGDNWNVAQCLLLLADIEAARDHPEPARKYYRESLARIRPVGDRAFCRDTLARLAALEANQGQFSLAAKLLGATRSRWAPAENFYPYTIDDTALDPDTLVVAMGADDFARAHAAGKALDMDAAIHLAIAGETEQTAEPTTEDAPAALVIQALGDTAAWRHGHKLEAGDWTYALPRELMFYLLVNGPCSKDQVGLDLWPNASPEQLRGRFRSTLYQLRKTLGDPDWVRYHDGRYTFDPDGRADVDLRQFERAAKQALDSRRANPGDLDDAIRGYRGDFLAGETVGEWADVHRERLRALYRKVALARGEQLLGAGDCAAAATVFQRLVEDDAIDEAASRGLATALWRGDDRARALRCLDTLARQLRKELDAAPEAATQALREKIATD